MGRALFVQNTAVGLPTKLDILASFFSTPATAKKATWGCAILDSAMKPVVNLFQNPSFRRRHPLGLISSAARPTSQGCQSSKPARERSSRFLALGSGNLDVQLGRQRSSNLSGRRIQSHANFSPLKFRANREKIGNIALSTVMAWR